MILTARLARAGADGDESSQALNQENARPAAQVDNGFRSCQSLSDLVKNEGNKRQSGIVDVCFGPGIGGP